MTSAKLPGAPPTPRRRWLRPALLLAPVAGAAWLLWRFNPRTAGFFPPCPFHAATGYYCPGCGSTRALHALTHLDFAAALRFNPLATLLFPVMIVLLLAELLSGTSLRHRWENAVPARWLWAFLIVVIGFGIARNVPFYPLTLLAPH